MTNDSRTRRTVLRIAGASAGVALFAGCGGPGEENGSEEDGEPEFEEGTGNGQERENGAVDVNESNESDDNESAGNESGEGSE